MSKAKARAFRPPWVDARVVKACTALSPMDKMIWLEHRDLTNGQLGATIGAGGLARRIGASKVTVERARHLFLRVDLIRKSDRGAGRTASWCVQIPNSARPQQQRLNDDDVEHYAELLSEWIVSHSPTPPTGEGG